MRWGRHQPMPSFAADRLVAKSTSNRRLLAAAAAHLTLPSLRDGPLPLPLKGGEGMPLLPLPWGGKGGA